MCFTLTVVVIRNSELVCGAMDKGTLGSGSKNNIFYVILRDYGEEAAAAALSRLARLCPAFLSEYNQFMLIGFVTGLGTFVKGEIINSNQANFALYNPGKFPHPVRK